MNTPYENGWNDCAKGNPMRAVPVAQAKAYQNGYRECRSNGYAGTKPSPGLNAQKPEAFAPGPRVSR